MRILHNLYCAGQEQDACPGSDHRWAVTSWSKGTWIGACSAGTLKCI